MATKRKTQKVIRIGVLGLRRGLSYVRGATDALGMKLVAICDARLDRLNPVAKEHNVTTYRDYDRFLEHDFDAVVLANFFHQHTPFAIKALQAGKHVLSETATCFTAAEGVALVEAVERSGLIYMFAENYPFSRPYLEMRRLYRQGAVGEFVHGECEYLHPGAADMWNDISRGVDHWRNWLPSTYYSSHALAPLMHITGTEPVKVNGFSMPYRGDDPVYARRPLRNDACSMIALRMNTGATCKLLQFNLRGHSNWCRVHGSLGAMENLRTGDHRMLRLVREQYHQKVTTPTEQIYLPNWPQGHEAAEAAGHGGSDHFMNYHFAHAIRTGRAPYFDVHRGVAMSMVGIQAWRSVLADSAPFEIPNFRKKAVRDRYRDDHWNPDPTTPAPDGESKPPCSVLGEQRISKQQLAYAKKNWVQT